MHRDEIAARLRERLGTSNVELEALLDGADALAQAVQALDEHRAICNCGVCIDARMLAAAYRGTR